jgi:hypothetical protein
MTSYIKKIGGHIPGSMLVSLIENNPTFDFVSRIKEEFSDISGECPNEFQKDILFDCGATKVYLCLNPLVIVHKTASEESSDIIDGAMNDALNNGAYPKEIMFQIRERMALYEINSFLSQNKGQSVALVYGGAHKFIDQLENYGNYRLYSKQFIPSNWQKPMPIKDEMGKIKKIVESNLKK